MTASGIDEKLTFRHLFILRNADFPSGKVTNELKTRFLGDGGKCVAVAEDDLRTFLALRELLATEPDGLMAWLQATKPLCKTAFFSIDWSVSAASFGGRCNGRESRWSNRNPLPITNHAGFADTGTGEIAQAACRHQR
jgi:hypothetical protein